MSTLVNFTPSATANFTFQATFDGSSYNCIVTWNYGDQRYFLSVNDGLGNLIYCLPLIGSPDEYAINLNKGYFTTSLSFNVSNQQFLIG